MTKGGFLILASCLLRLAGSLIISPSSGTQASGLPTSRNLNAALIEGKRELKTRVWTVPCLASIKCYMSLLTVSLTKTSLLALSATRKAGKQRASNIWRSVIMIPTLVSGSPNVISHLNEHYIKATTFGKHKSNESINQSSVSLESMKRTGYAHLPQENLLVCPGPSPFLAHLSS